MADDREPVEVGVDLPATTCPNCGAELDRVENPDGSVSGKSCGKCYKGPSKSEIKDAEKAAVEQSVPAETGVTGGASNG